MSTQPAAFSTAEVNGFSITSNSSGSAEDIERSILGDDAPSAEGERVSKAASELGKKGGEAAAKARAKEAREAKKAAQAPAAPDAGEEPETEQAAPAEEPEKPSKKGDPRHDPIARMQEATRKEAEAKRELQREREERQRERADYERRLAERQAREAREDKAESAKSTAPADDSDPSDPEPQADQFEDFGKYTAAMGAWGARKEMRAAERKAQEAQFHQSIHGAITARDKEVSTRFAKAVEEDPGYWDKISADVHGLRPTAGFNAATGQFEIVPPNKRTAHHAVTDEILSSEHAPALMLHLSEHPDVFQRLTALKNNREIARAVAKLEAKVEARLEAATAGPSTKPEVSKAHPPVKPVAGAPSAASGEYYREGESFDEWNRRTAKKR